MAMPAITTTGRGQPDMSDRVRDVMDEDEFDRLLCDAESNAVSDWDVHFISDMRDRFTEYGDNMFLSDSQLEQLERIANGD